MTGFPQLLCGWAFVNLESSGAGVGVVARSGNWPAALGFTSRELGALVGPPLGEQTADSFALEFALANGVAVAGLKTPSTARPGTCVTHLIAGEPGTLDGATALMLHETGGFRTALDDSLSPTEHWQPATPPDGDTCAATADAMLAQPWLPTLIGAALAYLAGQGPAIALHVEHTDDAVTMLKALYGILPRNTLRELTFATSEPYSPETPAIAAVRGGDAVPPPDRHLIAPDSAADGNDTYPALGRAIVEHRRAGIVLPDQLATVHQIRDWCYHQHLRTVDPMLLDDAQLTQVLTDPDLTADWFTDDLVARRAIGLALERPGVARALAELDHYPSTRAHFEQALTEHITADTRDRARATQVAEQLGFDLTAVAVAVAWQRLDTGTLSATDAEAIWPRLHQDWTTGDAQERDRLIRHLQRQRALRDLAIGTHDRFLVYETIRAEINDPAVHAASSRLLHTAMYSKLPILAQFMVNVSGVARDRYVLEQLLACAPNERLPALLAECARYPAVDAAELLKALTLTRAEPEELVAALRPAWTTLRAFLNLPQPIEALAVLDATADPDGQADRSGRFRLSRTPFQRSRRAAWTRAEVSAVFHTAATDPGAVEEHFELLRAAMDSDIDFVATCMADHSHAPTGPAVLHQVLACTPRNRLAPLLAAAARHRDIDPFALLEATAALDLDPADLTSALEPAWPHLRTRLDLPRRIATLVVLDPAAAEPTPLKPLESRTNTRRRAQFWR
ncbi:GAP1-M domain-containing protein [Nocardia crassostreae]|uniref:GAP1-M domain-containing protein n=1 Tax=Nocardia crassostreae TaxID=53428 RepID=UPI000833A67D|nr:hypothetical protein [Nocardia crassostreae]